MKSFRLFSGKKKKKKKNFFFPTFSFFFQSPFLWLFLLVTAEVQGEVKGGSYTLAGREILGQLLPRRKKGKKM